jgi:hypothetical protein
MFTMGFDSRCKLQVFQEAWSMVEPLIPKHSHTQYVDKLSCWQRSQKPQWVQQHLLYFWQIACRKQQISLYSAKY